MDSTTRSMWLAVLFVAGAVVALLVHSLAVAAVLLVVGGIAVGVAQQISFRRNKRQ